jgi:mRNA interferase RelE/StbE
MNISYAKPAKKAIERMEVPTRKRIKAAINDLPAGDVKKLQGYTIAYRLRVGGYRVLFDMDTAITITNILPRGDAYKK